MKKNSSADSGAQSSRFTATQRQHIVSAVIDWYASAARDLPWRRPGASAWGVMVSEFMLQQTPVSRVLEPWTAWLKRWPTPSALATEPSSAAVAAWGRLGYPRRALRLHAAATTICTDYGGKIPSQLEQLRSLPGVGEYTAAAIASFAFESRAVVLDTNVRRVLARVDSGNQFPANATTSAERKLGAQWLPDHNAATWATASMELGALICSSASPQCDSCPVHKDCAWLAAGKPAHVGAARRTQNYAGTDRQARGALLEALRTTPAGLTIQVLLDHWPVNPAQSQRALEGLLADGLAHSDGKLVTL